MQSNCGGVDGALAPSTMRGLPGISGYVTSFPASEAMELHCATLAGLKRPSVENG
jgi:hypothetical protein